MAENWRNKRVLVTGGSGFIGAYLVRRLVATGAHVCVTATSTEIPWRLRSVAAEVRVLKLNLPDHKNVQNIFDAVLPEYIFHLGAAFKSKETPAEEYTRVNVDGTRELYVIASSTGARHFVALGSRDEYGSIDGVLTEDRVGKPTTPYGASKLAMTTYLAENNGNMATTVVRPSSVYGPAQTIRMFIPLCINACMTKKTFSISPSEHRGDFVFVDDVAQALIRSTERQSGFEIINVGLGVPTPFKDIAASIAKRFHDQTSIQIGGRPYNDDEYRDTFYSVEKATALLDWSARVNIEDGLDTTVKWYKEHSQDVQRLVVG